MLEPLDGTVTLPPTISSTVQRDELGTSESRGRAACLATGSFAYRNLCPFRTRSGGYPPPSCLVLADGHKQDPSVRTRSYVARPRAIWRGPVGTATFAGELESNAVGQTYHSGNTRVRQMARPVGVQIQIDRSTMSAEEGEFIRDRLEGWALHRQFCTVVAEHLHPPLFDEHRIQYSGGADERDQVQLGGLLPASIVLSASMSESLEGTATVRHMALLITMVREGQVLGPLTEARVPNLPSTSWNER